jgi:hypothetical protein
VTRGKILEHILDQMMHVVIAKLCDTLDQLRDARPVPGNMWTRDYARTLGIQHGWTPFNELSPLFLYSHLRLRIDVM